MLFNVSLVQILVRLFVAVCILPVHEFAHAYAAHRLGDDTARLSGRMTLNPLAHIDPIGGVMMVLAGVGYAKAVPVNIRNFNVRKRKKYMAIVSLAGPVSNIIMCFLFVLLGRIVFYFSGEFYNGSVSYYIFELIIYAAEINASLAIFNLIPIPPLDGSRILGVIVPSKQYYKIMQYERYSFIVVLVLAFTGLLSWPIREGSDFILGLFDNIVSIPFELLM